MSHPTTKARILVVDDEPDVIETLRYRLELEDDLEIETASDGIEALGKARVRHPDLILLDVMMPGENGYRVSHLIRADETAGLHEHRSTILLLTARDLGDDPQREQMFIDFSGADEMIYKPFDLEALVTRIREYLDRTQEASEEGAEEVSPRSCEPLPSSVASVRPAS